MKRTLIICLAIALILVSGCMDTPHYQMIIHPKWNETVSVGFSVPMGYTETYLIDIPDIGTYNIVVKTKDPRDVVKARWIEGVNCEFSDKFGNSKTVAMEHFNFGRIQECTSDLHADCSMTMQLARHQKDSTCNPVGINIFVSGSGDGTLLITKISDE